MKVKRIIVDIASKEIGKAKQFYQEILDDVDYAYAKMKEAGFTIAYNLTDEPWGVRRFYVRDPFGKLVNILAHR
jgi:uncharacterized glyoxalase superfamily protein PhnB